MIASVTRENRYFSPICVQLREDKNIDDRPFHVEVNSSAENKWKLLSVKMSRICWKIVWQRDSSSVKKTSVKLDWRWTFLNELFSLGKYIK